MIGDDGAGVAETGGDTTGGEATEDDVKVETDVEDKEEDTPGFDAGLELPGVVRGVDTEAVPVAGTVSEPVFTETFLVGKL